MNQQQDQSQQAFDAKQEEYKIALYASPRNEQACLELAQQLLSLATGTRLESRQQQVVDRHLRNLAVQESEAACN